MEIYQKYYIYCSECGKEEEGLNTSYYTAELNFKGKGWQEIEGYNLCSKCVEMINKEFKETSRGHTAPYEEYSWNKSPDDIEKVVWRRDNDKGLKN